MKYVTSCFVLVIVGACSGSGGGTPAPIASAEIDSTGGAVDVQQGNLSGAAIQVPANAVAATTSFTIAAGSNVNAGAGTTNVGPAVRFGPAVTAFQSAINVTIPYSPGQAGTSDVMVVQRDDVTGGLTFHNAPAVNAGSGLVTVSTTRFSTFQAFIGPAAATFNMSGFWIVSTSNQFSTPTGNEDENGTAWVEVTQTGTSVTIDVQDDADDPESLLMGTVDGATYSVTGGADTIVFTLTDADNGTGTLRATEDGIMTGADLTLTRQQSATFDIGGSWSVTVSNSASTPPGNENENETVPFTFTQVGTTWTLTNDGETHTGFLSGARYFIAFNETSDAFNEVEVLVELTFTDANNGTGTLVSIEEFPDESIIRRTADLTVTRTP